MPYHLTYRHVYITPAQVTHLAQDTDLGTWMLVQAIEVYAGSSRTNDFFFLHGVSAAWALKQVLPLLEQGDRTPAARDYVNALVGTYASQEQPPALGIMRHARAHVALCR